MLVQPFCLRVRTSDGFFAFLRARQVPLCEATSRLQIKEGSEFIGLQAGLDDHLPGREFRTSQHTDFGHGPTKMREECAVDKVPLGTNIWPRNAFSVASTVVTVQTARASTWRVGEFGGWRARLVKDKSRAKTRRAAIAQRPDKRQDPRAPRAPRANRGTQRHKFKHKPKLGGGTSVPAVNLSFLSWGDKAQGPSATAIHDPKPFKFKFDSALVQMDT